jgi:hypothetical protein
MKNTTRSSLLGLLFAAPFAFADFAPMAVGNTWVYRGQVEATTWGIQPGAVRYQERITLKVRARAVVDGAVHWTVSLRDSVHHRESAPNFRFEPIFAHPDTVLTFDFVLEEAGDSLRTVSPNPNGFIVESRYFQYFASRHLAVNDFLRYHRFPLPPQGRVQGTLPGYDLRDIPGTFFLYSYKENRAWHADGVGLYWSRKEVHPGCDTFKRELRIVSFNGFAVDAGVEPPSQAALAKESEEAKIACSIRRPAARGLLVRPAGAEGFKDVLGRLRVGVPD